MASILAADDSVSMRRLVVATLRDAGFDVVEAVDGVDAWNKASAHSFDLLLADQHMPGLDGIALTRKLRQCARFRNLPILILTTESGDEMKRAGREAGANGWLVKPFQPTTLVEMIDRVTA